MKKRILLPFLLLLLSTVGAGAETRAFSAPSRITRVTVFADRAQVTRSARLTLSPGVNLVSIDGLPRLLAEDSLRVEGKGAGRARIGGITVKIVFLEQVRETRVHELEVEIAALNRKLAGIEARSKGLLAQRAFIDSIRVGWGERISKELTVVRPGTGELGEALKFVGDSVGRVEEGLLDVEAAKKPLGDRIAALQQELEQYRGEQVKEVRSVQVAIEADREMPFDLELSYLVGQARWEPGYDLRLAADGKDAELVYRARVWQQSGEEWPRVSLALATARPDTGGAPPELFPWRISLWEPRPASLERAEKAIMAYAPAPSPVAVQDLKYAGLPPERPMEAARPMTAQVATGQTSALFNIPVPVSVPADGTRADSIIAIERVPVVAEYLTVPKLSPRVYLKSQVTNRTAYPLIAGEVNVFNDNVFTGRARLKNVSAGERFDLFFGADDRIKVKREAARVQKRGGILGNNSVSYRTTVALANYRPDAIVLSLLDQLPLAGNAEIKVALEDASQKPDETRPDGTLVWKLSLAAGESRKITYDIVIEYPKGRELTGIE